MAISDGQEDIFLSFCISMESGAPRESCHMSCGILHLPRRGCGGGARHRVTLSTYFGSYFIYLPLGKALSEAQSPM